MSDTFTVNITETPQVFTVDVQEAADGITPQLRAGDTALEVSSDEGDTWSDLITYDDFATSITDEAIPQEKVSGLVNVVSNVAIRTENNDFNGENSFYATTNFNGYLGAYGGGQFDGTFTFSGDAYFSYLECGGDTFCQGSLTIGGNTTIGASSSNSVAFNAKVFSPFLPSATNTYNLGSSTFKWASGFFGTALESPVIRGGSGTTQTLTLQTTSGVGTTGADILFKVGNNGATEAARITNAGSFGAGTGSTVSARIHAIATSGDLLRLGYNTTNYFSTSVGSTGNVTFGATGSLPYFNFVGGVRIGDAGTPAQTLHVKGAGSRIRLENTTGDPVLEMTDNGGNTSYFFTRSGEWYLRTDSTSKHLYFQCGDGIPQGNVRIGGISGGTPASQLVIQSNTNSSSFTVLDVKNYAGTSVATVNASGDVNASGQVTIPNQTAAGGSSAMTRDLGDARYGQVISSVLASDFTVNSTTAANSSLSLTLTPGKWLLNCWLEGATASTTGGVQYYLLAVNSGDTYAGTFSEVRTINGGASPDRYLTGSGAGGTIFTGVTDAPGQVVYGKGSSLITVSATATYVVALRQRTTTDASNPAILKARSWVTAQKV